jgi:hypothetical protein
MNLEWGTVPFRLITPAGTLEFNTASGQRFLLDDSKCSVSLGLRAATTDIPQASGAIFHLPRFESKSLMALGVEFWDGDSPACASALREMDDLLFLHLLALLDGQDGRIEWDPSGADTRILDNINWGAAAVPFIEATSTRGYTFAVDSPLPYAITLAQTVQTITDGSTATVTNGGNAPFFPVIKANGPTSAFTITNLSVLDVDGNPLQVVYDSSRPGAVSIASGHYAELDFFRNTAYLDGAGANLKPGIDPTVLDFFPIRPGANSISVSGCDIDLLLNNAWGG